MVFGDLFKGLRLDNHADKPQIVIGAHLDDP